MRFHLRKWLCLILLLFILAPISRGDDGGNISGGGTPDKVVAGAIKLLLEGGGLKLAMLHYLSTLQAGKVSDDQVRESLKRLMAGDRLKKDIMTSNNYVIATSRLACRDAYNVEVPASTRVGEFGGSICFDVPKLAEAYRGYTQEEILIHLAGLAFHEHMHHFQIPAHDRIQENEDEANRLGGYVLLTAKTLDIPVLNWASVESEKTQLEDQEFLEIKRMHDAIRAKEKAFLQPKAIDYAEYPDFKDKSDRGLFRLLPRETYDGQLSLRGGGAYYSFSMQVSDYDFGPEIELSGGSLSVGFSGCDYGSFVDLGHKALEQITTHEPALQYLLNFRPGNHDENLIRRQQHAAHEVIAGNFSYSDRVHKIERGQTYGLRSISFDRADVLVAFKIVRIEKDGSLVIAWKLIKRFPTSTCQ